MSYTKKVIKDLLRLNLDIMTDHKTDVATSVGSMVLLSWLEGLYHTYVASALYVWATRVYLLHLLDNTIFVDKSSMHVHICYL